MKGKKEELEILKYDITNFDHFLRRNSKVMIIRAREGSDILAALYFDQGSIVAVKMKRKIIDIVNRVFGDSLDI